MTPELGSIQERFRARFGESLTVEALDRLLLSATDGAKVKHYIGSLPAEIVDRLGVLEWAYCNAASRKRADALERWIKATRGRDCFHFLAMAQQFVWTKQSSTEYDRVNRVRDFFARYRDLDLGPFELRGCRTLEQMEAVLALHRRVAGGDLKGFYGPGVRVLNFGKYSVSARKGTWEVIGGATLHLSGDQGELVRVGGYFRWQHCLPETTIVTIQGGQGMAAAQHDARDELGIHPANALLLLYLQMSRIFGQRKVRIRSRASEDYNYQQEDSEFYRIPRNYFRLSADRVNGRYEFSAAKRDSILDKFRRKHPILAGAFASLEVHLASERGRIRARNVAGESAG